MTDQAMRHVLAFLFVAGFLGTLGALLFVLGFTDVSVADGPFLTLLTAMTGLLGGQLNGVTEFYFGSSSGSKDKTAALSQSKGA